MQHGRHAVVIGGTRGLGRASAEALRASGAEVLLTGRRLEESTAAADEVGATALALDLSDPASLAAAVRSLSDREIDILVLNGGGPPPGAAATVSRESAQRALDMLLLAQIDLVGAVLPGMRRRGFGRIIAIGSSGVRQPIANLALSNLARAALAAYLKTLAAEVAADGVTVNMVLPGRIDTDRVRVLDRDKAAADGVEVERVREGSQRTIPAGRYGAPAEFAAAVAFLGSREASYITGQQLSVDGGLVKAF